MNWVNSTLTQGELSELSTMSDATRWAEYVRTCDSLNDYVTLIDGTQAKVKKSSIKT
jgi:hypothetical protein